MTLAQLINQGFCFAGTVSYSSKLFIQKRANEIPNGRIFWAFVVDEDVMYVGYILNSYSLRSRIRLVLASNPLNTYYGHMANKGAKNIDVYFKQMPNCIITKKDANIEKKKIKNYTRLPWD